jgi:hypothetical protein
MTQDECLASPSHFTHLGVCYPGSNASIQLSSPQNPQPATFSITSQPTNDPANPLVTEQLPAYTIHTSVSGQSAQVSAPELSVPEPSTAALFIVAVVVALRRRRYGSH